MSATFSRGWAVAAGVATVLFVPLHLFLVLLTALPSTCANDDETKPGCSHY